MSYSRAWECKQCPEQGGANGCPAWVELVETNVASGEERITRSCLFPQAVKLAIEVLKAANRPAAAVESIRNGMVAEVKAAVVETMKTHLAWVNAQIAEAVRRNLQEMFEQVTLAANREVYRRLRKGDLKREEIGA